MLCEWDQSQIAAAAGGTLYFKTEVGSGPKRVIIDSREAVAGDLFIGLSGEHVDGGEFAFQALEAGAWGVIVTAVQAEVLARKNAGDAAIIGVEDPLAALGLLANRWRWHLPAKVIGVTGSVGKTTTKDLIVTLAQPYCNVWASQENFNTEIGLPLSILAASSQTELLVLEMAMRGSGQIAELAKIAEPDVGVITCIAPVHLETLGSLTAIAQAKAELIEQLDAQAVAVVPANEPLLEPYLKNHRKVKRFGAGGDIETLSGIDLGNLSEHLRTDALAAVAALAAVDIHPQGSFALKRSALREERIELGGGIVLINDCYNANPTSLRSALIDVTQKAPGRVVAVLGDMLELGVDEIRYHREVGVLLNELNISVLVTVGSLAEEMATHFTGEVFTFSKASAAGEFLQTYLREGDTVLIKGSRGLKMEVIAHQLQKGRSHG